LTPLPTGDQKCIPIAEMITVKVDMKNISTFLTYFIGDLEKISKRKNIKNPQIFVTDYTWVNIHPILNVFLKTTIQSYLLSKWSEFANNTISENSVIMIDKLHFIKFLLSNARRLAKKNFVAETFVCCILHLCKCKIKEEIKQMFCCIVDVFCNENVSESSRKIIEDISGREKNYLSSNEFELTYEGCEDIPLENFENGIKKNSPFYTFFVSLKERMIVKHCLATKGV